MNEGRQPERIQYLDMLRVFAMLSVVFLHTAAGDLRADYGSSVWHFSNALTSLMSTSVPLFFMISGAVLLDTPKTLSVGYTLKRRVPRVLVPFLVWSLFAIAYYAAVGWGFGGAANWTASLSTLKNLPAQPTAVHLWFMYALIPLYLLSPIVKRLADSLDHKALIYLLILWVFFSSLLPTVAEFLPGSYRPLVVLNSSYNVTFLAGFAGYFIIGYYLMHLKRRVSAKLLALVIAADTTLMSLGTWWKSGSTSGYSEAFKSYTGIFVLVLSIAVFLLFKELMRERRLKGIGSAAVGFMVPLSFGVYLIHLFAVDLIYRAIPWSPAKSVLVLIGAYLVVLAVSLVLIFAILHVRLLGYAFTGQRYRSWRKVDPSRAVS
jgi:surface polysaccharide O-acyltransferase-like enzyme